MAQTHEWVFYELMWRAKSEGEVWPLPWWVQQYFRRWVDFYDSGLFPSKEAAFAANAYYRYWNMVGVKNNHQECLIGEAGEIEPVYDQYTLSFFLFDPLTKKLYFPQFPQANGAAPSLEQSLEDGYLPVVTTIYRSPIGIEVQEKVLATTIGLRQRSVTLVQFTVRSTQESAVQPWLCLSVAPPGPTGFQRHNNSGQYIADGRLTFIKYLSNEQRVVVNSSWGPAFDAPPAHFGVYGNTGPADPNFYLTNGAYQDFSTKGTLNGQDTATDYIAGICSAVFAWPMNLTAANNTFSLSLRLPVDDYRSSDDLVELRSVDPPTLENNNRTFWINKLDKSGLQLTLPPLIQHLANLFRTCRANLLMLSDEGAIHPGPTIYDSFWVRDSSVEGIACALVGDQNLAEQQFGYHYPSVFNFSYDTLDVVSLHGFFGGEHEKNDREWDSNGQALWAIGRFDRIRGNGSIFGAGLFSPYVYEGALWLRDNRTQYGLLPSGWSAEHLGDKGKPHYWDDFWAIAGLWEAARLAERIGAPQAGDIWAAYNSLQLATANSIRWVLAQQRNQGFWETFIPTGPADVGRLDSTIIGTVAYFHPCRLYMGAKLGSDIDWAARQTLETIWNHFLDGGFRHDAAWNCYGPYLTIQLAHAFLLIGELDKMDQCLYWLVGNAAYATVSRHEGDAADRWQVVLGAWNEQHCYPISKDFAEMPWRSWYMGDIPHGWACAEFMLLLRDILFFEAEEDTNPHIYLASGVLPRWVGDKQTIGVSNAPTIFGTPFSYRMTHDQQAQTVDIEILQAPPNNVYFVYPCRFGSAVRSASADGKPIAVNGNEITLPAGTTNATIIYQP